jgi:hypothetical protein
MAKAGRVEHRRDIRAVRSGLGAAQCQRAWRGPRDSAHDPFGHVRAGHSQALPSHERYPFSEPMEDILATIASSQKRWVTNT